MSIAVVASSYRIRIYGRYSVGAGRLTNKSAGYRAYANIVLPRRYRLGADYYSRISAIS